MKHAKPGIIPDKSTILRLLIAKALILVLLAATTAIGAESGDATKPITTADPEIPVGSLDLRVKPLTRSELGVEAQGWLLLVKTKVEEISEAEIAVKQKTEAIDQAEDMPETNQAAAPDIADAKTDLLEQLTDLRAQRTALSDRMNIVLEALETKGGEAEEYRQYIDAVSEIKVGVADHEALCRHRLRRQYPGRAAHPG